MSVFLQKKKIEISKCILKLRCNSWLLYKWNNLLIINISCSIVIFFISFFFLIWIFQYCRAFVFILFFFVNLEIVDIIDVLDKLCFIFRTILCLKFEKSLEKESFIWFSFDLFDDIICIVYFWVFIWFVFIPFVGFSNYAGLSFIYTILKWI